MSDHYQHTESAAANNQPAAGTSATPGARPKSRRGFASMDPQRQREIARLGGRASHASGNAHEFTSEEARAAGRKSHQGQPGRGRSRDPEAAQDSTPQMPN